MNKFTTLGVVTSVHDGDTFRVNFNGENLRIRLYGIDTPEINQAGGHMARDFAQSLVLGKSVIVQVKSIDKYKRKVAVVILPGGEVYNEEALANGFAWHYKQYSNDSHYAELENRARNLNLGIWGSQEPPLAPWEWRRRARASSKNI